MTGLLIAAALASAPAPLAEPAPPTRTETPAPSRWYGRVGGVGVFYRSGARVALGGQDVPDSSVEVSNSATLTFDIGYDISDDFSVQLMTGVPPRPSIAGARAITVFGEVGQVRFGPVVLTGLYRLPRVGPVRPYVGLGGAYAIIFRSNDGSVSRLRVHNDWGFVLQAGAEVPVSRRLALFADVKKIWISVDADGSAPGGIPVDARIQLNPILVSAGLKVHFR